MADKTPPPVALQINETVLQDASKEAKEALQSLSAAGFAQPSATTHQQITDAVTAANADVVAETPAMAMGTIYQSLAHATGTHFENAISAQGVPSILTTAATDQGVMQIYSIDTVSQAVAVSQMLQGAKPPLAED